MQLAAYRSRKYFNESLQAIGTSMIVKSALLLSKYLARQIESDFRHNQFIDFIKKALPLFLEHLPEVKGVRIQFKGRLNGSDRSKTQWFKYGQIPFHTIREKIEGETLQQKIAQEGKLEGAEVGKIFTEVLRALKAVHLKGFVHRGLKPDDKLSSRVARRGRRAP